MARHRNFACTDFEMNIDFWENMDLKYLIIGEETCPNTGNKHWQIAFSAINPCSLSSMIKKLKPRHVEVMQKPLTANIKYCKKDGNLILEKGEASQQGKRNDLEVAIETIKNGGKLTDIDPVLIVKYERGFKAIKHLNTKDRTEQPKVIWLWGLSGTGKTRRAVEHSDSFYIKDGTQWWDGYDQQDVIIIDDFDGRWPFRDLLRILDRYPYQGQTKGAYVKINSPTIYITCEFPPSHFWSDNDLKQVTRRLSEVIEITQM